MTLVELTDKLQYLCNERNSLKNVEVCVLPNNTLKYYPLENIKITVTDKNVMLTFQGNKYEN